MLSNKSIALLSIVILSLLLFSYYLIFQLHLTIKINPGPNFPVKELKAKPILSEEFVKNPDFIYDDFGWMSTEDNTSTKILTKNVVEWIGDGWYDNNTYGNRTGILVLHPVSIEQPRYVQQTVFLPKIGSSNYNLVFGIRNAAEYLSNNVTCADNIFKFIIIDNTNNNNTTIFEQSINTFDGWKDYSINLNSFSGKSITLRLEGWGGGPCGNWYAEWGNVDYIDILKN